MSDEQQSAQAAPKPTAGGRIRTFIRIMNVRLRFIFLMVVVGLVAGNWDNLMNRYDRWRRPVRAPETVKTTDIEFYCPMHPNIIRAEPGNCPICGMPLAKRDRTAGQVLTEGVLARVQMSPLKVAMGRIGTTAVEYRQLSREIRTVGIVDYDETKRAFIAARIKGRVDKLMVNYVGQHVAKGDPLVWIYSPDLLVAQEELLTAVRAQQQPRGAAEVAGTMARTLVEAARRKLTLWGITEEQINAIISRGTPETHLTIYSPIAGIVTEKKVLEGSYVNEGDDIYTIADLSDVWMQAKVFEDQIGGITVGTAVEVTSTAYPNEIFAGRITFVAYTVEAGTRTVASRVEVANPDYKLKPGMYVQATIRLPVGKVTEAALATSQPTISQPATGHHADTAGLAGAYLKLVTAYAQDKADADAAFELGRQARSLVDHVDATARAQVSAIAEQAGHLQHKDLKEQRTALKPLSKEIIEFLRAHPPAGQELFVVHCPMVNADWLSAKQEVANPYYGSGMLKCGQITGQIKPSGTVSDERFAMGYYCPIYPDRLYAEPQQCPLDKFPLKYAKVEKVLAVPEASVVDTGTRKVVYRESSPGVFDMVEVQVGQRAGEFYPVVSGVKPGDQIATSGAFVVDAENRLNPAAGAQYFGASGGPQAGGHAGHGGH